MNTTLAYIDDYFNNELSNNEKVEFESKCLTDEVFANEVAFYLASKQVVKEELLKEKSDQWSGKSEANKEVPYSAPVKKINFGRWISYAAAACVIFFIAFNFFYTPHNPTQLADNYIKNNLESIHVAMDASHDTLTLGIEAYKKKDYDKALQYFRVSDNDYPLSISAKKFEGYIYLIKKDFDSALKQFDELANMQLRSNPGTFLKALTLMERNKEGDKAMAKQLLQKVVDQNLEGSEEARDWLKDL